MRDRCFHNEKEKNILKEESSGVAAWGHTALCMLRQVGILGVSNGLKCWPHMQKNYGEMAKKFSRMGQ